jgi:hypothetical protein
MKRIKIFFPIFFLLFTALNSFAQKDLGDQEYVIVKDYKPMLAESYKISDLPKGDSTSSVVPPMTYNIPVRKIETNYETGVIKPIRIKDEPNSILQPALIKIGLGNYSTYNGEIFYNMLRSKTSQFGVHAGHISGKPSLSEANAADFSHTNGNLYGKYFADSYTFSGNIGFDGKSVHYYGLNPADTIVKKDTILQKFNLFNLAVGIKNKHTSDSQLDYDVRVNYNDLTDNYEVKESDALFNLNVGRKVSDMYFSLNSSFDYFRKTDAKYERLNINSNLSRSIVNFVPTMTLDKEKIHLKLGADVGIEKNVGSAINIFPDVEISVPVATHILSVYANLTGGIQKNSYRTFTDENPFTAPYVKTYKNTLNKFVAEGGVKGNFSSTVSFMACGKYYAAEDMAFFYNDSSHSNLFNVMYDSGTLLDAHVEAGVVRSDKLSFSISHDQYIYTMDTVMKPWHRPMSATAVRVNYIYNKQIILNATLLSNGAQYARIVSDSTFIAKKINGYADLNLGVEYRYLKNISFFLHVNNLLLAKYERWYNYPNEKINFLAGLTYAF